MSTSKVDSFANASVNRRLRGIYEQNGANYGKNTNDHAELERRIQKATQLANQNIDRVMHEIKISKSVDLCFLIDATGSMGSHIEGVRTSISKIIKAMQKSSENQLGIEHLRFAVVAYRDFDLNEKAFSVMGFSDKPNDCIDFCSKVSAFGGGDAPEDIFGGLEKATQLAWSPTAGTRIIFHMGDEPCHGRRYQSEDFQAKYHDDYPNGDPQGRTPEQLFNAINELKIDYYFGRITEHTDAMIAAFSVAYGKVITAFDVQSATNIAGSVIDSISTSVETNVQKSKLGVGSVKVRHFRIVEDPPDWDKAEVQVGEFLIFDLPKCIADICKDKTLTEKKQNNARVKVAPNPFAEGSERIAYFGLDMYNPYNLRKSSPEKQKHGASSLSDATNPTKIVLKEYKFLGWKQNTLDRYRTASEIHAIAFFMADKFNEVHGQTTKIKFLKTKTLILKPKDTQLRVMTCEKRLFGVVDFIKFTNNVSYTMQQTAEQAKRSGLGEGIFDLVSAFSHWTHHVTGGFFMIVDLQGCVCRDDQQQSERMKIVMTDPAVHCLDITRFAPLNLGNRGMQAFFDSHRCGPVCQQLKLPGTKKV